MEVRRQQQKINKLRLRIVLGVIISVIFIVFTIGIDLYHSYLKEDDGKQVKKLAKYISNLKKSTKDFKTKVKDIKKYRSSWENASKEKKDFSGINIDVVNINFANLSEKYSIINPTIKVSVPEVLKGGVYKRKFSNVMLSNVQITFNSLDDIKAQLFVKDFIGSLPGYKVIINFAITKTKSYSHEDLISISSGKINTAVRASLEFSWYVLKGKQN